MNPDIPKLIGELEKLASNNAIDIMAHTRQLPLMARILALIAEDQSNTVNKLENQTLQLIGLTSKLVDLTKAVKVFTIALFALSERISSSVHFQLSIPAACAGVDGSPENLGFFFLVTDAFGDVGIDGVIRLAQVAGGEAGLPRVFHIIPANGIGEDRQQIFHPQARGLVEDGIIEVRVHEPRMDVAPAIAKTIGVIALDVEAFADVELQDRNAVVPAFQQQVHRVRPQFRRIEPVEQDWASAALRMTDFSGEDGFGG